MQQDTSTPMDTRQYSTLDTLVIGIDQAVRTLAGHPHTTGRTDPAAGAPACDLETAEQLLSTRLMRINHTGEICAQALYQGQALTAQSRRVRESMEQAAAEENDHLHWCETRIKALGGHTSLLNPLFYGASLALGAVAGKLGDRWNLGFLAETEHQVVEHLDAHLEQLPKQDYKSRSILQTMREDEQHHATTALDAGGAALPLPVRGLMRLASKIMTKTTYWV